MSKGESLSKCVLSEILLEFMFDILRFSSYDFDHNFILE